MPNGRVSTRMASDSTSTACLVAWYQPPTAVQPRPPIELMLTMVPALARRMAGSTSCDSRARPNTLTSKPVRQVFMSLSSMVSKGGWMEALFTSAST